MKPCCIASSIAVLAAALCTSFIDFDGFTIDAISPDRKEEMRDTMSAVTGVVFSGDVICFAQHRGICFYRCLA